MTAVEQALDPAAQIVSLLVLAMLGAVTAFLSRRAAKGAQATQARLSVPTESIGMERDPGPVLGKLEASMEELKRGQREMDRKVDSLTLQYAKHEGEHAGFSRDMERLMRRVFNGGLGG